MSIVGVLVDVSPFGVATCIGLCSRSCSVMFSNVKSCVLGCVCMSNIGVFNVSPSNDSSFSKELSKYDDNML